MVKRKTVKQYATIKNSDCKLSEQEELSFSSKTRSVNQNIISVSAHKTFQVIEGFGGAFTEAVATVFYKMSPSVQKEILDAYFNSEKGNGYTLCRTHINSCDFSLGNYSYCEVENDTELNNFTIGHDREALIPLIKCALEISKSPIKLLASPWSPPAWMKTTGMMNRGGKLKPECCDAWAKYYAKYVEEYSKEGISIWGISVQNEPEATQTWDSCVYTAEDERDFVKNYLGPTLEKEGCPDIKVIIWDHNRNCMYHRAQTVYDDPEAAKYVWGTGFHWYEGDNFDNLQLVHDAYPDKKLLFTEGCQEGGTHSGSWDLGERYAHSMINDLNRWCVGWIDWNLILDEMGGPNHVGNYCSAPIIANTKTGKIEYQNSYYYIGHFSRFIKPGAKRIISCSSLDSLETTAFINTDETIAVVVLNRSDGNISFALEFENKLIETEIPGHSIKTLCIL